MLDPFCDAAHLVENFVRVLNAQVRLDDAAHGAEHLADCPVHVVDWNALFADQLVLKLDLLALGPEFRQLGREKSRVLCFRRLHPIP